MDDGGMQWWHEVGREQFINLIGGDDGQDSGNVRGRVEDASTIQRPILLDGRQGGEVSEG